MHSQLQRHYNAGTVNNVYYYMCIHIHIHACVRMQKIIRNKTIGKSIGSGDPKLKKISGEEVLILSCLSSTLSSTMLFCLSSLSRLPFGRNVRRRLPVFSKQLQVTSPASSYKLQRLSTIHSQLPAFHSKTTLHFSIYTIILYSKSCHVWTENPFFLFLSAPSRQATGWNE